jgi:DNA-binding MarR family transcriptional regulator
VATAVGLRAQRLTRDDVTRAAQPHALLPASPGAILDRIRLIARTLDEHPGLTSHELAERLGCDRRRVSLLLLRLEEHGHLVQADRRWFLPGHAAAR